MSEKNSQTPKDQPSEISFIEELKRQWMAMIDAITDPIMIVSPEYRVIKANKSMAQHSKIAIKELIDKPCHKIFADRDTPCESCAMQKTLSTGTTQHWNMSHQTTDRYFEVASQPVLDQARNTTNVVHVYRDRTEAKQLQEQLVQSEKLASIGLLAGGVAHEINNPLSGVLVFAQMILRDLDENDRHYSDVQEIINAAQRCKLIVDNLLDFARKPSHSDAANTESFEVISAIRSALTFVKVGLHRQDIQVSEHWHDESVSIIGNQNKLIQVFLNLIQNAYHAMPEGGHLTLTSHLERKHDSHQTFLALDVKDSGSGIPSKQLPQIFDPFFTTKEPGQGTGLGLSICYSIIKELGGTITVDSKVDEGTRFRILLPYSES